MAESPGNMQGDRLNLNWVIPAEEKLLCKSTASAEGGFLVEKYKKR